MGKYSMFKGLPSSRILKQIANLNRISGTPETAFKIDPAQVSKIELLLIQGNGHGPSVGLKKFWRHNLPTLKFHNEDISFVVTRINTSTKQEFEACPAKIVIHKSNSEKVQIDCAKQHSSKILESLVKLTGAASIPADQIPTISPPSNDPFH